jgi:hypothetical protein
VNKFLHREGVLMGKAIAAVEQEEQNWMVGWLVSHVLYKWVFFRGNYIWRISRIFEWFTKFAAHECLDTSAHDEFEFAKLQITKTIFEFICEI